MVRCKRSFSVLFAGSPHSTFVHYADATCSRERARQELSPLSELRFHTRRIFIRYSSGGKPAEAMMKGSPPNVKGWVAALRQVVPKVIDERSSLSKALAGSSSGQAQQASRWYGVSLEEMATRGDFGPTRTVLPGFVAEMIRIVLQRGLNEPGIFRLSGTQTEIEQAQQRLDAGQQFLRPDENVHNVAGLLKLFLRSLPDPLLTYALHDKFIAAIHMSDIAEANAQIAKLVAELPRQNYAVLSAVMKLLHELLKHTDVTKMDASNFGIVFGPAIIWGQGQDALTALQSVKAVTAIAEYLCDQYPVVFSDAPRSPGAAAASPKSPKALWVSSGHTSLQRTRRRRLLSAATPVKAHVVARFVLNEKDPKAVERQAASLFATYDADKSNFLDLDEFVLFFSDLIQVGQLNYFSRDDIMDLMMRVSEGDMKITLEQFLGWWTTFHSTLTSADDD